ncbi:GIY-YIG nuclease family protein [Paenibacillus sp. GCM10012307]|uniref:GIY-YIG nuclease family protein n=1 Tax=Paenibacillus roseus TaxID=2798579 RepID=A0A934JBS3_9BACL|nr:GIY-YIG nuclease family protein [Paenibacillus roseus]MBJ6364162.1 GIY-YIG nuclease family protein [Paenibacillus roseus]
MKINMSMNVAEVRFDWDSFSTVKSMLKGKPGVYVIHKNEDTVLYIGMSKDLSSRLAQHVLNKGGKDLQGAVYCEVYLTESSAMADILETYLINKLKPELNFGKAVYKEFVQDSETSLYEIESRAVDMTQELEDLCFDLYSNHADYKGEQEPSLGEELYLIRSIREKERELRRLRSLAGRYRRRSGTLSEDIAATRASQSDYAYKHLPRIREYFGNVDMYEEAVTA